MSPEGTPAWQYLCVYELDGDPKTILADLGASAASRTHASTPAMDSKFTGLMIGSPVGGKIVAGG